MKKKILIFKLLLVLSLPLFFTGCTVDNCNCGRHIDCKCGYHVGLTTKYFTVNSRQWAWNMAVGRYECAFNIPEITQKIYDEGLVHAGVFITENNFEVLKSLPFVQTYKDNIGIYTETISYDIAPGSILFSIQASDLSDGLYFDKLEFKVSWVY